MNTGGSRENVLKASIVLPVGEIREMTGQELELVDDAGGITGLISEVTLSVQPLDELEIIAVGTKSAEGMQRMAEALAGSDLPIWSVLFINPRMAALKNKAPLRLHNGHAAEHGLQLPETYVSTIA